MNLEELLTRYPLPFELLSTQKEDVIALLPLDKALMDLPVGYGKTVVATLVVLGQERDRALLAVPPILIRQWVKWLNSIPGAGLAVGYSGTKAKRNEIALGPASWVIVSYSILRNDFKRLSSWLEEAQRPALVVDECQNMKSSESVLFRNVKELSNTCNVLLMTGTPMSNPGDAYSYIKVKNPEIYRDRAQFDMIHVAEIDFFKSVTEWQNLDILHTNLRKNGIYRDKVDVHGHLKARTWPIYYDLSPEHAKLYKTLMEEQLLMLPEGKVIDATTAQKLYNASQQIIANFDFYSGDENARANIYDLLDQVIDEIALHRLDSSKLIVWTWFKKTTASVTAYLANYGAVAAYSEADSKKSIERFMDDPKCRALVAQPGSAGAGLNPQYVCSESIFIESPTRTITFKQAAGRIDRQGQVNCANNRIAVATGTIQESMFNNLLENDDLVSLAGKTKTSIREVIFGKMG